MCNTEYINDETTNYRISMLSLICRYHALLFFCKSKIENDFGECKYLSQLSPMHLIKPQIEAANLIY